MQDILDKEKMEEILVAKWTEFLNVRKLLQFTKDIAIKYLSLPESCVNEIKISRFEFSSKGFILWLEAIIIQSEEKHNTTIEVLLSSDGCISYIRSMVL